MIFFVNQEKERIGIEEIKKDIQENIPYILKVLQLLVQKNFLSSQKGPNGGFSLVRKDVTLFEIISAVEGKEMFSQCGFFSKMCNIEKACPIHLPYSSYRMEFCEYLQHESICNLNKNSNIRMWNKAFM